MNLYLNGNLMASTPATGVIQDTTSGTFRIGKGDDANGIGEVWNGTIDEVRVWPYGRTQAEIRSTMGMTNVKNRMSNEPRMTKSE